MDTQTVNRLVMIGIACVILFGLIYYYNNVRSAPVLPAEKFYNTAAAQQQKASASQPQQPQASNQSGLLCDGAQLVPGAEPADNEKYRPLGANGQAKPADCFPHDRLTAEDLLPGNANSTWSQVNPAGQGELANKNLLTAGYHIGVNTVGQTLRNPNLQLRSEPLNPQVKVGPWNQSTIEPDVSRRALEIGSE